MNPGLFMATRRAPILLQTHAILDAALRDLMLIAPWLFLGDASAMPWLATVVGVGVLVNTTFTREVAA
jgi:hypothetical protein